MHLSLKIPESPIERQAFHSRTFRRIIFTAGSLSLFLATIHSIASKSVVHREHPFRDYRKIHRADSSYSWPLPAAEKQVPLDVPVEKIGNNPSHIEESIKELPEVIRIPFEEAVRDVELEGWEDDWFSSATYDYEKKLAEPKLDFVYNCELLIYKSWVKLIINHDF